MILQKIFSAYSNNQSNAHKGHFITSDNLQTGKRNHDAFGIRNKNICFPENVSIYIFPHISLSVKLG